VLSLDPADNRAVSGCEVFGFVVGSLPERVSDVFRRQPLFLQIRSTLGSMFPLFGCLDILDLFNIPKTFSIGIQAHAWHRTPIQPIVNNQKR
jgi:hypothetical protein